MTPGRCLALLLLPFAHAAGALATSPEVVPEEPAGGGGVAWFSGEGFDLIGDMRADLPWRLTRGTSLFFALDTRINILRAESDLFLLVQDVDYTGELGVRGFAGGASLRGVRTSFVAGQQGSQQVDAEGHAWVRYLGVGFESRGHRTLAGGVQWRVRGGAVFDSRAVDADAVLRAGLRLRPRARSTAAWRRLGLDAEVDAVLGGERSGADWRIGPSLWLPAGDERRLAILIHYLDSDNPLGLGSSGWLVGLDYGEGGGGGQARFTPPDVSGIVGAGASGDARAAGTFVLRLLSPALARSGLYAAGDFEGNVLTDNGGGEIYWLYDVGIERRFGPRALGFWLYHRSNHALGESNDRITSFNVLELGGDSVSWRRAGRHDASLGWRARAGYLLNGSFGLDRRWHARGGLRWAPWVGGVLEPFLLAELEAGDIERHLAAIGVAFAEDADVRIEYRDDEQYLGDEQTVTLLTVRAGF